MLELAAAGIDMLSQILGSTGQAQRNEIIHQGCASSLRLDDLILGEDIEALLTIQKGDKRE